MDNPIHINLNKFGLEFKRYRSESLSVLSAAIQQIE